MANVFKENAEVNNTPNLNNFDLTKRNHLSLKMGVEYPILCQRVVPGDSFRIDAGFGLRFMPMPFPTQTPMRAHVHYFLCYDRNHWDDHANFIQGLDENAVKPYINQTKDFYKTGSLADYLGVPSTLVANSVVAANFEFVSPDEVNFPIVTAPVQPALVSLPFRGLNTYFPFRNATSFLEQGLTSLSCFTSRFRKDNTGTRIFENTGIMYLTKSFRQKLVLNEPSVQFSLDGSQSPTGLNDVIGNLILFVSGKADADSDGWSPVYSVDFNPAGLPISHYRELAEFQRNLADNGEVYFRLGFMIAEDSMSNSKIYSPYLGISGTSEPRNFDEYAYLGALNDFYFEILNTTDISELPEASNPYNPGNPDGIRLNAIPFRCYEAVHYAYYANSVLQPLKVNGEVKYNQYNTTKVGGADITPYHLFTRNWEYDFLTSALPSPQQGPAPLVGMTALGDITIEDENGVTTFHADVDNHGNITKVVATSPVASTEHARTAMNMAAVGMNINDFRGTNALQRWLELNMRKGYKYIDFIKGHFGKAPSHLAMDMPEYVGGFSRDVVVNSISQTANINEQSVLGDYAGQASVLGSSNGTINVHADDYGYIIGILTVTPVPAYSQLLPKFFLEREKLDYYFEEFSQIGMQPITYEEVCPLNAYQEYLQDHTKRLTDTFGYQRPNYDMVANVDEVHGLFRTDLNSYLINRLFVGRPELGSDFITINPKETNSIFTYTQSDGDVIIGEVVQVIHAKRPVPRIVIPSLGR